MSFRIKVAATLRPLPLNNMVFRAKNLALSKIDHAGMLAAMPLTKKDPPLLR